MAEMHADEVAVSGPKPRSFSSSEAGELARAVVHHDPGTARAELLVPEDAAAAAAGVRELAVQRNAFRRRSALLWSAPQRAPVT